LEISDYLVHFESLLDDDVVFAVVVNQAVDDLSRSVEQVKLSSEEGLLQDEAAIPSFGNLKKMIRN
jgi:hypothetical protein